MLKYSTNFQNSKEKVNVTGLHQNEIQYSLTIHQYYKVFESRFYGVGSDSFLKRQTSPKFLFMNTLNAALHTSDSCIENSTLWKCLS